MQFDVVVTFIKKHPGIQAVLAYRVDRITRNYRDAVICDDLRKDYDKEIHFVFDRLVIDKNSSGRDITDWDTKVYLAKQQINRLRDDAIESGSTQLRMGRKPGKAPIGYTNITLAENRKDIILDVVRAPHIKQIFELYATGTYSDRTIAALMKDKGLRTVKGNFLSKSSVEQILKNPFYSGSIFHNGKLYPHHYQTLISKQLFDKCTEIRKGRAENGNYKPKYKEFAFRGITDCWYCKTVIGLDTKKKGRIRYIQCSKTKDKTCPQPRLHEDVLLKQVKEGLVIKMQIPDDAAIEVQDEVIRSFQSDTGSSKERAKYLLQQISDSKTLILESYKDLKRGNRGITQEMYDQIVSEEEIRQASWEEELSNFDEPDQSLIISSEYVLSLLKKLPELYDRSNDSEKLEWHRLLFSNTSLKQERLLWELNKPFDAVLSCGESNFWLSVVREVRTIFKGERL